MINRAAILWLSVGLWGVLTVGCSNSGNNATAGNNNDDSLKTDIQAKLYADPATKGGHVNVDVKDGVVTLTGGVPSSDVELAAMKIANGTTGVRSVNDQMKVDTTLAQNQPSDGGAGMANHMQGATGKSSASAPNTATPPPPAPEPASAPTTERAAAEPARSARREAEPTAVTIPAGERLSVRTTEEIDSGKASEGQRYRASLEAPLTSRGRVIVPAGAPVTLVITGVQSAGRIKGNSALSLRPVSLEYQGRNYPITGSVYEAEGKARGKNTAIKTGIGAAAGALIGGLAGGGKGAAIGSAAGGGAGFGWNAFTHGQQVKIPSETVLAFRLQAPVTVPVGSDNLR
jgi:hypothetical protein